MKNVTLYYSDLAVGGTSDKEYRIQIVKVDGGFVVDFQFGRRGGTLQSGTKTKHPVSEQEAQDIFDRLLADKRKDGYDFPKGAAVTEMPARIPDQAGRSKYPAEAPAEISADEAKRLFDDNGFWMQMKMDGHRCQIEKRSDGTVVRYNKRGEPASLPGEVAAELKLIPLRNFFMDGELISNSFVAFDLLAADGLDLRSTKYGDRFEQLVGALAYKGANFITAVPTWRTRGQKRHGYEECVATRCEGVVFKNTYAEYRSGDSGQHKKVKFTKTASCKVVAVGVNSKANAAVALLDGAEWVEVAHVSTIGKGKITVGDVVEVEFLCATKGRRLREPRIKEVRNDEITASECTIDQLAKAYEQGVAA